MAKLTGQSIASSYDQILIVDDTDGISASLQAIESADTGSSSSSLKISTSKCEVIPASNSTSLFEVSQADGTAVLSVDTTNARVGIGTTAPMSQLHVYNTANTWNGIHIDCQGDGDADQAVLGFMTEGDGTKAFNTSGTKSWAIQAVGNAYTTSALRNDLLFQFYDGTSAALAMCMQYNGSVGIGTVAPVATLEVENTSATGLPALLIDNDDTDQIALSIAAANIDADVIDITADAVTTVNVIDITADALTSGKVLNITSTGTLTGSIIDITADSATTGKGINLSMDALTSGSMLYLDSDSSSTGTRNLVEVINNNASATGTTVLKLQQDSTGAGTLTISTAQTTTDVLDITADSLTTGKVIDVTADALTSGSMLYLDDNSASTTARNCVSIIQNNDAALDATALLVQSDAGGTGMKIDKNYPAALVAADTITGLHVDFDHTVPSSGTATQTDVGIDLDVNSATLGTSTTYGMDIDVVGATSGTHTVVGLAVDVGSADTNYAALFNGGNVGIGEVAPANHLVVADATDPSLLLQRFTIASEGSVENDVILGSILFGGIESTGSQAKPGYGALIRATASGTWSGDADDCEARLQFFTNSEGDTSAAVDDASSGLAMTILESSYVGIGTATPGTVLDVTSNVAGNYIAKFKNEGDATNRYGIAILCGKYDASGTNHAVKIFDGDDDAIGGITFSGATVAYGAFTANHDIELPSADNSSGYDYGTLVETTEIFYKQKNGADTERGILYKVQKSSSAYSKSILGAYAGKYDDEDNMHQVYVLGDGHILCCNEKGNISVGDGICSSSIAGLGMKADTTCMIIGIAQKDISFSGSESKLVPVQYQLTQWTPWDE